MNYEIAFWVVLVNWCLLAVCCLVLQRELHNLIKAVKEEREINLRKEVGDYTNG